MKLFILIKLLIELQMAKGQNLYLDIKIKLLEREKLKLLKNKKENQCP